MNDVLDSKFKSIIRQDEGEAMHKTFVNRRVNSPKGIVFKRYKWADLDILDGLSLQ